MVPRPSPFPSMDQLKKNLMDQQSNIDSSHENGDAPLDLSTPSKPGAKDAKPSNVDFSSMPALKLHGKLPALDPSKILSSGQNADFAFKRKGEIVVSVEMP